VRVVGRRLREITGVPRGRALLGVLVICTAGCATPQPRSDQESWFCERTPDGRDWACSQQRQRNSGPAAATQKADPAGVAASRQPEPNAETGPTTVANDLSAMTEQTQQTRAQLALQQRESSANRWSAALPALSAGVVEVPPVSESKAADREPRKPPPEPEPVFARWEKAAADADAKAAAEPRGEVHEQLPQSEKVLAPPTTPTVTAPIKPRSVPAVGAVRAPGPTEIRDRRTYTVQIGAFKSDRAARAYIAQHNLGDLPTLALRRESRGPDQYILGTFGRFATVRTALEAWHRSGAPRDLEIWVRPVNADPQAPLEAKPAAVASPAS
jgi:septal ring-binding cell division protein DamX